MLWRRLLFLLVCIVFPKHDAPCTPWVQTMGPWAAQAFLFLCLHLPLHTLRCHRGHMRKDLLRLATHITAIAVLVKLRPAMAWACSIHAILHLSHVYTLPITLATLTACPHDDITVAYALVWPELVEYVVIERF